MRGSAHSKFPDFAALHPGYVLNFARMVVAALSAAILASSALADEYEHGRRIFLEKADCQYCHGWAGDGAGSGQSPGGAANLRRSQLDRTALITVIGSFKLCAS